MIRNCAIQFQSNLSVVMSYLCSAQCLGRWTHTVFVVYIISPNVVDRHCASGNIHSTDTGLQCELLLVRHNGAGAVLSLPDQSAVCTR